MPGLYRLEVMPRICILHLGTPPVAFIAGHQKLRSSDMDLFVELIGVPEGVMEHLEILYQKLETSKLAATGTLTIVRGARVPIIKYIDSHGSGLLFPHLPLPNPPPLCVVSCLLG